MATRRGRTEGSVHQRHDHPTCPPAVVVGETDEGKPILERPEHRCQGRWVAMLDLGIVAGKRKRKAIYGRTRKEAADKLQDALTDRKANQLVVGTVTVEAWLRYWLDVICPERSLKGGAQRGLKVNTMKSHRSKIERYLIPHIGHLRLDRLEPGHIRAMWAAMRDQGLSEATLRQTHAVLRRALEVAERERKIVRNPATLLDPPGTARNRRDGLTLDQARRVLALGDLRWWVALFLGLRQGEALALRWSDVDLDRGILYVSRSLVREPGVGLIFDTPKSAAGVRAVPLPPKALAHFKVARIIHDQANGAPDGLVFAGRDGKPIDHRADWKRWRQALDHATTPPWAPIPYVALHAARNTAATLLEEAGVPDRVVAQILGQSTVQVTHGYQHTDLEALRAPMLALEGLVSG